MNLKFWNRSSLSRLGNDERTSGLGLWPRLLRDEEGSYLLYMTLVIPFLIGVSGLSGEGGLIFYNHRSLQSAADAAAYSTAIAYSNDTGADITTQAKSIVASYGFALGTNNNEANVATPTVIPNYAGSTKTAIKVDVSRPQSAIFAGMFFPVLPNSVSATAIISGGGGGNNGQCILSLASTGTSISLGGTSNINATNCGVFSNSNDPAAIQMNGNDTIIAGSVGTAGGVNLIGNASIGPPPGAYTAGDGTQTDPYATDPTFSLPTPGTCLPNNTGVVKNNTVTLNPGTYCTGGIDLSTHANVTLSPGVYILKGSQFLVDSQSAITGKGVTLVFLDPSGDPYPKVKGEPTAMDVSSGATVDLVAPTSGSTAGMLIMADTTMPTSTVFDLWANGVGSTGVGGVIYIPHANFLWGGGPILTGGCTQMIAYTISLQGNATFNNTGCDFTSGGGPGINPIGSVVTLVE